MFDEHRRQIQKKYETFQREKRSAMFLIPKAAGAFTFFLFFRLSFPHAVTQ